MLPIENLKDIYQEYIKLGHIPDEIVMFLYWENNWSPKLFKKVFNFIPYAQIKRLKKEGYVKSLDMISASRELTFLYQYGSNNPMKIQQFKNKAKNTTITKYGGYPLESGTKTNEKVNATNIEKYGCENPMQNKEISNKTGKTQKERQEEYKQKSLEKYGVEYPAQRKDVREKNSLGVIKAMPKIIETKKKNNTISTSKPEQQILKLLQDKFLDVKYQYRDDRYPFNCDYYIPQLDLFIEFNGHWTHGNQPYIEDKEECEQELKQMQAKAINSTFYQEAIDVWTRRDVLKRNTAKRNNLNWLEFFNIDDFFLWYNNLKDNNEKLL